MQKKLVSAIIPCYNYGLYLNDAIQSLRDQTYKALEIIVVNDGSTDELTLASLERLAKQDIRVIHSPRIYPSAARNLGFFSASGQYILTLDADDMFGKSFVEKAIKVLDAQPEVGAVSSWTLGFGYKDFLWKPAGGGIANFLTRINCSMSALSHKHIWEEVGGFDESLTIGHEDWDFWIRLTKRGWQVHIIPEVLFYYRQKKNSRVHETNRLHNMIHYQLMKKHPDVYSTLYPHLFSVAE